MSKVLLETGTDALLQEDAIGFILLESDIPGALHPIVKGTDLLTISVDDRVLLGQVRDSGSLLGAQTGWSLP